MMKEAFYGKDDVVFDRENNENKLFFLFSGLVKVKYKD